MLQDMNDTTLFEHPHYIPARKITKRETTPTPGEKIIAFLMTLVIRYNADLLPDEEPITFAEMAAQMGYERIVGNREEVTP